MTEEFNLSEKREILVGNIKLAIMGAGCTNEYAEKATEAILDMIKEQDKIFIKKLKEEMHKTQTGGSMITIFSMETIIDKLAGDDLVK